MSVDEIIQLLAALRPSGIEPNSYKMIVELIMNCAILELTRPEQKK